MRVRRCAVVWIEPREDARFELQALLSGGTGIVGRLHWRAHAPHLPAPVEVQAAEVALLGALGPVDWVARAPLERAHGEAEVARLLQAGLLLARDEASPAAAADAALRGQGWHAAAALGHHASRWQGVDAGANPDEALVRRGDPPPHFRPAQGEAVALPRVPADDFDVLLDARATCRNYDLDARVPLVVFSQLLARVFGVRGALEHGPGLTVVKRTSPSGGALHPAECLLIVQRVDGIAPGLYRYRMDGHALEAVAPRVHTPRAGDTATHPLDVDAPAPAPWGAEALRAFARIAVAGQDWFADAPVLCVLASRFPRNFWKYRNHAKAYRVTVLDVGHLSQTLQLCATRAGLAPFVTAAINELDIERAFGLDGFAEGALAVCGFGARAAVQVTQELDPNGKAWPPRDQA
jgi:putative peptide maturation dehydrogenase